MANLLDFLGGIGENVQTTDWGKAMPAILTTLAASQSRPVAGALNLISEEKKKKREQEIKDLIEMVSKGYQPVEPTFKRTQTAEQFMGPPQRIGGQAPSVGLNAPAAPPAFQDFMQTGQLGMPRPTLKAPEMILPPGTTRLPQPVGGTAFYQKKTIERTPKPTEKLPPNWMWKETITSDKSGNQISNWTPVKIATESKPPTGPKPTDPTVKINRYLQSAGIGLSKDIVVKIKAARDAGYLDAEIADFLKL